MIISMARTTEAFLRGIKTVTRRFWRDAHAAKFHNGSIHDVWDKLPRNGGEPIGRMRLTATPYKQLLADMPDDHFEREGGTLYWKDKREYIMDMGGPDKEPWVIEFKRINKNG